MVAAPFGFTEPFSCALVPATEVAAVVVTDGGPLVTNESTAPKRVPSLLTAIAQYQYVAPDVRPPIACENAWLELPAPRSLPPATGAREPKVSLHVPGSVAA